MPENEESAKRLVPTEVGGQRIYIEARGTDQRTALGSEDEIGGNQPKIERVFDGLAKFAEEIAGRFRGTEASRVTLEFGCDVAVESGTFVAVIGKASATSTIKVGLEWAS